VLEFGYFHDFLATINVNVLELVTVVCGRECHSFNSNTWWKPFKSCYSCISNSWLSCCATHIVMFLFTGKS